MTPELYHSRIQNYLKNDIHKIIYQSSKSNWDKIQKWTKETIQVHIPINAKILDAGCGYGALTECLGERDPSNYVGIDYCKDLIYIAQILYPRFEFHVQDIYDNLIQKSSYDWVISRALITSPTRNKELVYSAEATKILLEYAPNILILDYTHGITEFGVVTRDMLK